jgi:thiamine biosynthesis lipoprotein
VRRVEQVMGTSISLELADPIARHRARQLGDDVFGWMYEVDAQFSTYRRDSEISRLGAGELAPAKVSPALRDVLVRCAALWKQTEGYFDAYANGRLDPSGYVKGWAVQVASDRLLAEGAVNHCLNAGGDARVRGVAPSGEPWRVAVRHPWHADRTCCVVVGTDLAIATSGVYERGHHVIDPFTGQPARGLRSVTVTGSDLGTADAYATAAVAMGSAGLTWLASLSDHESAVVTDDGDYYQSDNLPTAP